jgi:hypothetical protein
MNTASGTTVTQDRNLKYMNTASGATVTQDRNLKRTHEYSFMHESHRAGT